MLILRKKIIVAVDGSPQSDKAAEEAVRLATVSGEQFKSEVFAVLVLPKSQEPAVIEYLPDPDSCEPDQEETLQRVFYVIDKSATEAHVDMEKMIVYGDPVDELLRLSEELECDVIVIGSSGKGRVKRVLQGSVSAKVAMQAHCSVYIVR